MKRPFTNRQFAFLSLVAALIVFTVPAPGYAQVPVPAVQESITVSTSSPLTEEILDGSVVTVTLAGRTFEQSIFSIRRAVSVSGIAGVSVGTFGIRRVNDTKVTVELTFNGDIDSDGTLTFTVGAIANYSGEPLVATLPVAAEASGGTNQVPTFSEGASATRSFAENTGAGQNIGNPATASDNDGGTLTYSLEGTDSASFAIVSTSGQLQTGSGVAYDYEVKNRYDVTVRASDGQGGSVTIHVTIDLTDVSEPPVTSAPQLYWNHVNYKIQSANLDGSNVKDVLVTGPSGQSASWGLALDVGNGKLYWTDWGADKIQRANLDGSNVEDLVASGLGRPSGLALDVGNGKMYWMDRETSRIQRADLSGSNVEDLVTSGINEPVALALDVGNGKMYWTDWTADKIQRAGLDGSNVEDLVTSADGLDRPFWLVLAVPATATPPAPQGQKTADFNGDGIVNFADFFDFVDAFGTTDAQYDLDDNGIVNFADFFEFVDAFGTSG